MSSLGAGKGLLEVGKFAIYVTIPIFLMYTFANNSKNLHRFMGGPVPRPGICSLVKTDFIFDETMDVGKRSYVVYPPEGPRPPSPEELREMARELARKRNSQSPQ